MKPENQIDFSTLLASSVHDIKNSLSMLLSSLDEVIDTSSQESPEQRKNYSILRGEASRINQTLIYLLGLYRLQHNQLTLNSQQIYIKDFLEEQVISQELLFEVNQVDVQIHCDDALIGYFDENLIAGVVNNVLVNCAKYTNDKITLAAEAVSQGIELTIKDNGRGYPQAIIDRIDNCTRSINFSSGSTNLGLFFAQQITAIHQCKGTSGSIELSNLAEGGGCFTLRLP